MRCLRYRGNPLPHRSASDRAVAEVGAGIPSPPQLSFARSKSPPIRRPCWTGGALWRRQKCIWQWLRQPR
eukprot:3066690-Pyramimonas_sp.AAC.1